MATVTVTGLDGIIQNFNNITSNQLPFALARALTVTARAIGAAETAHISAVFDRPTLFTQRAIGYTPSNKIELRSQVFVKDVQSAYLETEVTGGRRKFKPFEQNFTVTSPGFAMPGHAAKLNQFGNVSKAEIKKLINKVNIRHTQTKSETYFSGKPKGGIYQRPAGVYARIQSNTRLVPLLIFTKDAQYKPRFHFYEIGIKVFNEQFAPNFIASWNAAVANMRVR